MAAKASTLNQVVILKTMYPSPAQAKHMAKKMVREQLAACAQVIGGVTSFFRWEGKVQSTKEYMLLLKTTADRYLVLKQAVSAEHPYDQPEILRIETQADEEYAKWVAASCKS